MNRPTPVPPVAGLHAYEPPRHLAPVDLVLSGNEGDHPSPELLDAISGREVEILRSYPSPRALEQFLAASLDVTADAVIVTAGGDEAIDRICRSYLDPTRRAVVPEPTFVMLPHYVRLTGAAMDSIPWSDGAYPVDAVIDALTDATALVSVVTPNNPSGAVATAGDLRRLADAAPNAILLVDLAYTEYADIDLTAAALQLPNAIVVRTISKALGLAGLRVGYAAGPPKLLAPLRAAGGPFSVSGISLELARHALARTERQHSHVARIRDERTHLQALARDLGMDSPASQGNFALVRAADESWLRDALAGLGIAIRIFPEDPRLAGCARISCPGDPGSFARLCHALRTARVPQALLFDLDGVLADVSGSYRTAILETAASFGATVTPDDVARAKAAGNANNDWLLTHQLITGQGIAADLGEVTRRFEERYQGTDAQPGLRRNETLLPPRDLLDRLAKRLPLAIVTGRPRQDAERWLDQEDLRSMFAAMVCLEDSPAKPDPAPVQAALRQLGVERAWMIGDTPDDIRAARRAGAVPIGVVAAGDDHATTSDILSRAGAARVLRQLTDIEALLP